MTRRMKKFLGTIRILFILGAARHFGIYQHSGWDGEVDYCLYEWKGKLWKIPMSSVEASQ